MSAGGRSECSQEELRALADRLLIVQEEERRPISRELHDDINQRLAMLAVKVETLELRLLSSTVMRSKSCTWTTQNADI